MPYIIYDYYLRFWHSVYCTPVVSVIPLRQIVHFSQKLVFVTITAHVRCASGLSTGAHSLRPVHYASLRYSVLGPILFVLYTTPLSDIIVSHSVNHQLFADDIQLQKSAPLSEEPHQRTQCMHRRHKNMDDRKSSQTERRQDRSSFLFRLP